MAETLFPEQYQYMDDGVVLNADAVVPFVDLTTVSGLDSSSARYSSKDLEGRDGGFVDAEYETIRTVVFAGKIYTNPNNAEEFLDTLKGNYAPRRKPSPLYIGTDAGTRVVYGKSLGLQYSKDAARGTGIIPFQAQVACEDPRIYSDTILDQSAQMGTDVIPGRGYDRSYNYGYGTYVTMNNLYMYLQGNRPQPAKIYIYGPVANPIVIYDTLGITWKFSITLGSGEFLAMDLMYRTVMINNQASRRSSFHGSWYLLQPGANNFRFQGAPVAGNGEPSLRVVAHTGCWR